MEKETTRDFEVQVLDGTAGTRDEGRHDRQFPSLRAPTNNALPSRLASRIEWVKQSHWTATPAKGLSLVHAAP
ncbi:hypothetical protein LB505_002860 [Fusarium chuoi]|nr:hypothetical protein LB505_002860 [Fusarium chuoi]